MIGSRHPRIQAGVGAVYLDGLGWFAGIDYVDTEFRDTARDLPRLEFPA